MSGVWINGTPAITTCPCPQQILSAHQAPSACFAAATVPATLRIAAPRIATASVPATRTTTSASASCLSLSSSFLEQTSLSKSKRGTSAAIAGCYSTRSGGRNNSTQFSNSAWPTAGENAAWTASGTADSTSVYWKSLSSFGGDYPKKEPVTIAFGKYDDDELTGNASPEEVYSTDVPEAILTLLSACQEVKNAHPDFKVKVIISPSRTQSVKQVIAI